MTGPFKLKTGKELEGFFKTPNPTTKAVKKKPDEKEDQVIENMSNQETTSEIIGHNMYLKNLKKKASNKKRSDAEKALEAKEDAMGL